MSKKIAFSLAVSRKPQIGRILRGQVTGSAMHTDGDIIDFGAILSCDLIDADNQVYECTDLNDMTIRVMFKQPPRKRLAPPKSYNKPPKSLRPNWRKNGRNNN